MCASSKPKALAVYAAKIDDRFSVAKEVREYNAL